MSSSGPEAMVVLQREPDIDLVLMDVMMPVMDGYAAIRAIRALDALPPSPFSPSRARTSAVSASAASPPERTSTSPSRSTASSS
jgi:CheY-like chemotaxis protein